jgi:putative transposase
VIPGIACHITQRGVDRRETFSSEEDRCTYLRLLEQNLADTEVAVLGFCLMTNHVHLIVAPRREDSLSVLLRRVHGRYAQYYNARTGRTGHLWQNRFFSCVLGPSHLWAALAYVEQNPVRSGLVSQAIDYGWSSAMSHVVGKDNREILDMEWWQRKGPPNWDHILRAAEHEPVSNLRECTYAGRPFGNSEFMTEMEKQFSRRWTLKRTGEEQSATKAPRDQLKLFS